MTSFELQKKIETEYSWYTNEHYNEPNVVYVKVQWNGDDEPEDVVQTIVIDLDWYDRLAAENGSDYVVPFIRDEDVLYYSSSIEGVLDLCTNNSIQDFVIKEFVGFEHLKCEKKDEQTDNQVQ